MAALSARAQSSAPDFYLFADSLVVYAPDHQPWKWVTATEAQIQSGDVSFFINDPTLANPNQWRHAATLVAPNGTYTDIVGVNSQDGGVTFRLGFNPDSAAAAIAPGFGPGHVTPIGDGLFNATSYLNPTLQKEGYTALFMDLDADPPPVPDGGSTAGLLGLAMLTMSRLRRPIESQSNHLRGRPPRQCWGRRKQ
jgi:hypothetical protein